MEIKSKIHVGDYGEVMIHQKAGSLDNKITFSKAISACNVGNNIRYAVRVTNGRINEDILIGMTRMDMRELLYKVGRLIGE